MDLTEATDTIDSWLDLQQQLHSLTRDPATPGYPRDRIHTEWLPLFVSEETWNGDAPFTPFEGRLEPHAHEADQPDGLARMGRRKLFKVETWSAPDLGGVTRCLIGQQDKDWAGMPEFVLDVAKVDGALRFVGMYTPHGKCGGAGTLVKTGEPCTLRDRAGRPCVDGLIFLGGLSYDSGELLESNRIEDPAMMKRWTAYMER